MDGVQYPGFNCVSEPFQLARYRAQVVFIAVEHSANVLDDRDFGPDTVNRIEEYGKPITPVALPQLVPKLTERLAWRAANDDIGGFMRLADLQEHLIAIAGQICGIGSHRSFPHLVPD